MSLPKISGFLAWMNPHALRDAAALKYESQIPKADQWGYIMGYEGQVATWGGAKRRCFDCQGLADGYQTEQTGKKTDIFSRNNYSDWCKGYNGTDMSKMPQIPGVAVFVYGQWETGKDSAGKPVYINIVHHVGFPWKKFGSGAKDWLVIESKGSKYGVIVSTLKEGGWNRWGLMKKVFDYDTADTLPEPPPLPPASNDGELVKEPIYYTTTLKLYLLCKIGKAYNIDWQDIRNENGSIPDPKKIRVGQKLIVGYAYHYTTTQKLYLLGAIGAHFGVPWQSIRNADGSVPDPKNIHIGQVLRIK